jgi:hypothetical protein
MVNTEMEMQKSSCEVRRTRIEKRIEGSGYDRPTR